MIGHAAQQGVLPVGLAAIVEAVRLNGTAVEANLRAITIGRVAAAFPAELERLHAAPDDRRPPETLAAMIESRSRHLVAYQGNDYATTYRTFLDNITGSIDRRKVRDPEPFLVEVAAQLARLMAYKDEYEVARLYCSPEFRQALDDQFAGNFRIEVNLAPPLLAWRKDAKTGRPRKIAFGAWIFPVFKALSALKRLRGTAFDPFGWTRERRMERTLISEYCGLAKAVAERLDDGNMSLALRIAASASEVAGFGPVKEAGAARFRETAAQLMMQLGRHD